MSTVFFKDFKDAVAKQVAIMTSQGSVFKTNLQKEDLQEKYLVSFPEGTNPMYRERRVYDANYDLNFIGTFGGVVSFVDGKKTSVWDIEVGGYYQPVIDALREMVHNAEIVEPFYHYEQKVGVVDHNFETRGDIVHRWDHFFSPIPAPLVVPMNDLPSKLSKLRSYYQVLSRSLEEISLTSGETVLDLINEGGLYRGDEMKHRVELFIDLKKQYDTLSGDDLALFLWSKVIGLQGECRIRNTSIGTLLVDLSEGKDIENAVASFEDKISEGKYKRTSAVVTQAMISKAKDTVVSLGLEDALYRRYARLDDLTINNVLFADRDARKAMNPFDVLSETAPVSKKVVSGAGEEISIDDFMKIVVPKSKSIEVLVENKHINNLVSLISPENDSAGNILKWGNNFSWSYRGEVTDSLRERVSKAGGNVDGILRCSLSWKNLDDLDIHVYLPTGRTINFNSKVCSTSGGRLDIDMNAYGRLSESPVENVFWETKPDEGRYLVKVHNYTKRCTDANKDGFQVEVDDNGESTLFGSDKNPVGGAYMTVVEFDYSHKNGVSFINKNGKGNSKSETVWGIKTNTFQKVNMIMNSPNHWDGECTGNKHLFFSLTNCRNEEESRGFYNEYLRGELYEHRKAFEMLGGMLKAPKSDDQVSGLGFSSTKRNEATFKVDGRLFKVLF